jgi:tRNA 2-thiouridine synthesizing protein B
MAVLHLVSKSPADSRALERCLLRAGREDAILLIQNGVYCALRRSPASAFLIAAVRAGRVFVLADDLRMRGLEPDEICEDIAMIDYAGFVDLAARFPRSASWT